MFLHEVVCQKLLKLADVSWSYSKNKSGTFLLRHGVYVFIHQKVAIQYNSTTHPEEEKKDRKNIQHKKASYITLPNYSLFD